MKILLNPVFSAAQRYTDKVIAHLSVILF